MRWQGRRTSRNIIDRRGAAGPGGKTLRFSGLATVGIVVVGLLLGVEPQTLLQVVTTEEGGTAAGPAAPRSAEEDALAELVSVILADTEQTWSALFAARGAEYPEPELVLFTDRVASACGAQSSAVGPFYCPADRRVYIDLGFFGELSDRFCAPGDFAQAYVVAHEVGHHVQNVLGTSSRVHTARAGASEAEANALSVKQELQADCYAGVWAHHAQRARDLLEAGDLEEGLQAAHAIGDDTLQRHAGRDVVPETFTHGSAEQRQRWFLAGFESGDPDRCDTFAVAERSP